MAIIRGTLRKRLPPGKHEMVQRAMNWDDDSPFYQDKQGVWRSRRTNEPAQVMSLKELFAQENDEETK